MTDGIHDRLSKPAEVESLGFENEDALRRNRPRRFGEMWERAWNARFLDTPRNRVLWPDRCREEFGGEES